MIVASRLERSADQGRDPRALSQLDLSRPRLPGASRWRRAAISASRPRPDPGRRRAARRRCPRGRTTTIPTAIPSARRSASPTCSSRMQEDGAIGADEMKRGAQRQAAPCRLRAAAARHRLPLRRSGRRARPRRSPASTALTAGVLHGALDRSLPELQRATETRVAGGARALRARQRAASSSKGRRRTWPRPCGRSRRRPKAQRRAPLPKPVWQQALAERAAAALRRALARGRGRRRGASGKSGEHQGRPRRRPRRAARRLERRASGAASSSTTWCCVQRRRSRKGKAGSARPSCASGPTVQGAAVVLENKTGRILAMAGGFSYPLSQLNRATQAQRQPGSTLKPLTYLAALHKGLQPNTLVLRCAGDAAADRQQAATRGLRITGRRRTTTAARRAS